MSTVVERSVLVEFSAAQMRALVEDIESYPQFLPWCSGAVIGSREPGRVVATLNISYRGIRQQFTTENIAEHIGTAQKPAEHIGTAGKPAGQQQSTSEAIRIRLVSGPFKSLDGLWVFQPLEADACKVKLELRYEFANRLLESLVGPVFRYIADTMVEAFVQRARVLHGAGR